MLSVPGFLFQQNIVGGGVDMEKFITELWHNFSYWVITAIP